MRRGLGIAVGGFVLATACAVAWWNAHRVGLSDPATDAESGDVDGEPVSPAPPPPLASPGLDRRPRDEPKVPVESRAGPASLPWDHHLRGQVLDAEGRPLAGATVRDVFAPEPAPTATTDAEGRFDLVSTADAPGVLSVSAPGSVKTTVLGDTLRAGLPITLAKEWTITGTVYDTDTGDAITAIPLSASPATSPEMLEPQVATWNADGTFRVAVPSAEAYVLDVGARGGRDGAAVGDDWVPRRVEGVAGGTTGLRVALVRGRSIEGEIVDGAGDRLTRRVYVDAVRRTSAGDRDYTTRKIVVADAGGLRVPGLPPGRYDLHLSPQSDPADTGATSFSATVVENIEAGTHGLVVRLPKGFVLVGRLEDGKGAPVLGSGALYADRAGGDPRNHPVIGTVVGDGTFRVGPLDESYRYDLFAKGFAERRPATREGVSPRDANVVVVLADAKRIAGRVETEDGKPVPAGVPIGVVGETSGVRLPGSRVFGYTKSDGTFVVDGLANESFLVEAGGGRSGYLGTIARGVKPGTTELLLRVSVGVELSGTLVDEKGEPISATSLGADDGARVAAIRPYAQVGADGKFVLRGLRAGPVRLWATLGERGVDLGTVAAPAIDVKVVVPAR